MMLIKRYAGAHGSEMTRFKTGCVMSALLAGLVLLLAGCSRNPQVAKQKYFDRGSAYLQAGKYREASIEFQNAVQIDPRFEQAHYQLAQCFMKQADWAHAYQELLHAVEITPDDWKAQTDLGGLLLAAHRYPDARDRATTVLTGDPKNVQAQVILADSDAAEGDLDKALLEAQKAVQMDPARAGTYLTLAQIEEQKADAGAAEQDYQKAISLDSKSASAALAFAAFYERQKRWPEAERQYQNAIALEPTSILPRTMLARLYLDEDHKDLAEQTMRETKDVLKDNPAGYRALGDYYISQGETQKAADEFGSLYAEHPHDLSVARSYAQLLILQNNVDQASKVIDAILKASAKDPQGMILRGEIQVHQGNAADAIHTLQDALRSAPDNPMGHYQLGVAYADTADYAQAQTEWSTAERLNPAMVEPPRALAAIAMRKGDAALLKEASSDLMQLEPKSPEGYIYHASALYATGDPAGAEADLTKAITLAPQNPAGYIRMGDLRSAQKKYDEAEKLYRQGLALNPQAAPALTGLVNLDLLRNQPEAALQLVEAQIARVPNNSQFYLVLGQVEARNSQPDKAEAAYQKATELDKNNVEAFLMLASLQVSRGSADQAIQGYQQALQSNPRDVRVHVALADLMEARGDWQQAQTLYQQALQIEPDYALAANNLSYLMLEHGESVNVAFSLAQTARRGLPELPNSADTLGWAYYKEGAYTSAIDLLQEAVKSAPKDATYHYHLGLAYQKTNNTAMARQQLAAVLQINPKYSEAGQIRQMLGSAPQHD